MAELVWEGKYRDGQRACASTSGPPRVLHERHGEGASEGLLVAGDRCEALASLLPSHAGTVSLVYIDPPYDTGGSFQSTRRLGNDVTLRRKAYDDARGTDGWLAFMDPTLELLHALLAPDGVLFAHCDWRSNAYLRVLLDERFGAGCFRNEIAWRRAPNLGRQAASRQLGRTLDTIFVYSRTPGAALRGEAPRRSTIVPLDARGRPEGARWDPLREAFFTTAPRGDYTDASIARLRAEGRVHDSPSGKVSIKYFLVRDATGRWCKEQPIDTLWDDAEVRPLRHRPRSEDLGYDTQKPEGLLERIVRWATRPGDLVVDCFSGSGTTAAVAARTARRWIAVDSGEAAVSTTRRRLVGLDGAAPWDLATVGAHPLRNAGSATLRRGFDGASAFVELTAFAPDAASPALASLATWTDAVDAWFVDDAWDGEVFRARSVIRRGSDGALPLRARVRPGAVVRVRVVDVAGAEADVTVE